MTGRARALLVATIWRLAAITYAIGGHPSFSSHRLNRAYYVGWAWRWLIFERLSLWRWLVRERLRARALQPQIAMAIATLLLILTVHAAFALPVVLGMTTFLAPPPVGSTANPWLDVSKEGADPTGALDSTSAISTTISNAGTASCRLYFPSGIYKVSSSLTTISSRAISIMGDGLGAVSINYSGSGDCFRIAHTADSAALPMGGVADIAIDGSTAAAGAVAIHAGDLNTLAFWSITIRHFNAAGSAGRWFDNTTFWTEAIVDLKAYIFDCTSANKYTVNGGTTSLGYHVYLAQKLNILSAQIGYDVQSGNLYNGHFNIEGNVNGGAGNTATVWKIANGSTVSGWGNQRFEQTTGTGAFFRTIAAGGSWQVLGNIQLGTLVDSCAAGTIDAPANSYDAKALGGNVGLVHAANTVFLTSDALGVGVWDVQFNATILTPASTAKLEFHIAVNTATAALTGAQAAQIAAQAAAATYINLSMRVIAKVTVAGTLSVSCRNNDAALDGTALASTDGAGAFTQATGLVCVRIS